MESGPHAPTRAGFTLLEVLAALTIFLILLGMMLKPATRWHREQRMRSAIHIAQSTLRLARETAMTRREPVNARFLNRLQPSGAIRCFYWIEGSSSGLFGISNAMPDGVAVSIGTCINTDTVDVAYMPGWMTNLGIVRAVMVASNGPAASDWALVSTQLLSYAFQIDGSVTGTWWTTFLADGSPAGSPGTGIGMALVEARQTKNEFALTGTVEMTSQAGVTVTTARSL